MTQTDTTDILKSASRSIEMERFGEARGLLRPLLDARPDLAEGWLLLARAEEEAEAARAAFGRCLSLAPAEPVVWMEYALAEAARGAGGRVVAAARKAGLPAALVAMVQDAAKGSGARARGTGAATKAQLAALSKALDARDLRAVEARVLPVLKAGPGAVLWGLLGQARLDAGRAEAAAEAFRQGLRLEPYATDLRGGLVQALLARGDGVAALAEARRAAQHAPLSAGAQATFGRLALQAGLGERALAVAEAGLARSPGEDRFRLLAAEAALHLGRADQALAHAEARGAKAAGRRALVARCLEAGNRMEAALSEYDALLAADPADAVALLGRGQVRQTLGQAEGAEADLRAAIAADPLQGVAQRALAYGTTLSPDDPVVTQMRAKLAGERLGEAARRSMDYAMARVLQGSEPEAAARHLAAANGSMLRSYPYRAEERDFAADWAALQAALEPGAASDCDAAPVFVTGLPRSGTTLVEAILSAHPAMVAGGELAVLRRELLPVSAAAADRRAVTSDMLSTAGAAYVAAVERKLPGGGGGARWTDKSIHSFLEIGLIRAVLPKARIVFVARDPRDVGLSIWRNHFRDGTHRYAASQRGIADQIALARKAVAFWSDALPGAFEVLSYEALLDDPEGQSRRLLDIAGLDWDARVLDFHDHADAVRTLSFGQVRQPLYRTSKGGWRKSAGEISELIAALEEKGLLPE